MNTVKNQEYFEYYKSYEKQRYRDFLSSLSDNISFDSDKWICEKRLKSSAGVLSKVTIYFSKVPDRYKVMVKYFAVLRMLDGRSVSTVNGDVCNISVFLNFINSSTLSDISVITASEFKNYLDKKGYAESTKNSIWSDTSVFLERMNSFDEITLKNPFLGNPFESKQLIDKKYIPVSVAKQLDKVFMKDEIGLTIKTIYWLLRLIPSRISEIIGMNIDCVKSFDDHFCIFIPTWKQNGGYKEPIMRVIHIEDKGMGGYLLALIREQQKIALSYSGNLPATKQDALFVYRRQIILDGKWYSQNKYGVASWTYASYQLKEICKRYNIRDENGDIYKVTSHQFRHNGITDRLRAGFTEAQIAEMTAHHGEAMIYASYAHLDLFPETIVEPLTYETQDKNPYIMFGGRILNMDAITESRLLKNIRAHKVPGGVCSDVTNCKSNMWSCIACKNFIPQKEQLPYFKEQQAEWLKKARTFKDNRQLYDNFTGLADSFAMIIKKIEGALDE